MAAMTFRYLPAILWFLAALPLVAQTTHRVEVSVIDAETELPLPYVNVQVANSAQGGMTDEDGRYAFTFPEGRITILVSAVGYEGFKRTLLLNRPQDIAVILQPTASVLETVTVSSDDASERLDRPIMGVERLSIREIEILPVALGEVDVFRGLQLVGGVSSAGEASNGLSIRGGTIDQNLVLLDGAPVFTPTHLFGLFSVFTPDAVGSVDLYRANIPARFGGRVSSVVDVRSRNPVSDRFRLQGGIGLVSSRLSVETPLTRDKRLKVLASVRVGLNDFALRAFERLKNTRSKFGDGTIKLRYTADENTIFTFSGFYSRDVYEVNLLNQFSGITASTNRYDYATLNGTAEWLQLFSERTSLQTRLVHSLHTPDVVFPEVDSPAEIRYSSRIRYLSAQSQLDHRTDSGHGLTGGLQLIRYDILPGQLDPDGSPNVIPVRLEEEQAAELSAYLEDEWSPWPALTLSAGLRYTRYLQLGPGQQRIYPEGEELFPGSFSATTEFGSGAMQAYGGFEPRLGLSYALGDRTNLKAAYALNRQFLQNIFNSTTPLPSSRWKVADNNIRPQRSQLYSLGMYQLLGQGGYELSLEGYYRSIDNLLEYKPGAEFFLNPTVEVDLLQGRGKTYGAEFSVKKTRGSTTGQINYTYARALNRVAGNSIRTSINQGEWYRGYFDQPHTFNGSLTYDDGRTHRISLNLVIQSNRPYSIPNGFLRLDELVVPIFLERNNARLPTYHRLDFSWTIHNGSMKRRRWVGDWTLTFYNLYGRDNAYNIYYQPRLTGGDADVFGSSPLGSYRLSIFAAPIVSLGYSFKFE
jgi:hypothetical protein